jgi:hypothetical protein
MFLTGKYISRWLIEKFFPDKLRAAFSAISKIPESQG